MGKAQPWKKLSSKRLLNHSDIKIDEDTVILPNGKQIRYVRRAHEENDAVIVIAINNKGKILLQKEYSYPPNEIMWQLPGGSIKKDEQIIDAANRELAEESGYRADESEIIGFFYTNNRLSNKKQHIVVSTKLVKYKLQEDEDEFIDSYWINISDLHDYIKRGEFTNINLLAALNIWFQINNLV